LHLHDGVLALNAVACRQPARACWGCRQHSWICTEKERDASVAHGMIIIKALASARASDISEPLRGQQASDGSRCWLCREDRRLANQPHPTNNSHDMSSWAENVTFVLLLLPYDTMLADFVLIPAVSISLLLLLFLMCFVSWIC
jgi:hypothetical protein